MSWNIVTLEQLAAPGTRQITDGPFGSHLASRHYTSSGPRVIRLQNIGDGEFIDARAHISEEHYARLSTHSVEAGDLLVASLGDSLPRACLAPSTLGPAIVKADCIRVRLASDVNPKWVMYSLISPQTKRWADAQLHGTGRPRLGLKAIRQIPVPSASHVEQRRIVEIIEDNLSRLDAANRALITSTARARALIRATLMRAIPDVTEYPSHWLASTVDHAGSVTLGRQRHPDWHTGDNMQPYLRVANVFEDRIDTSDVMQMHWPEGTFERFRLVPGDILLNEGQTPELLGRPAMYRGEPGEVAFTNSLLRFQANALVNPEFALIVFRRHMHAGRFTRESRITTNIAHLSATRLKPIEFPIAPLDEQERIVLEVRKHLGAVGRLQEGMADASLRSRALRRAVLAAAFSGRLTGAASDSDLIEETAETLEGER